MLIKDQPLDDLEAAVADIADVPDWRAVWGPDNGGGPSALEFLRRRVVAATGWASPEVDTSPPMARTSWAFKTTRGLWAEVWPHSASFEVRGGWAASDLTEQEAPHALAMLRRDQWPRYLALVTRYLGEPAYVGSCVDEDFPTDRWRRDYDPQEDGLLAVWLRPGLEFHLTAFGAGLAPTTGMSIVEHVRQPRDER